MGPWCLQTAIMKCMSNGDRLILGGKMSVKFRHPELRGAKDRLSKLHVRPPSRTLPHAPSHAPPPDSGSHGRPRFRCSQSCATPKATRHPEPPTDLSDDSATPPPFARRCPGVKGKPVPH